MGVVTVVRNIKIAPKLEKIVNIEKAIIWVCARRIGLTQICPRKRREIAMLVQCAVCTFKGRRTADFPSFQYGITFLNELSF
jgi:hypothetical protein